MKIISLNIAGRANFGKDFDARIKKIIEFINDQNADIVCFQEVTFGQKESLASKINNSLNNPYKYMVADMSEKYTFDRFSKAAMKKWEQGLTEHFDDYLTDGLAVLSKTPISKCETIVMKPAPKDERGKPDLRVRIVQNITLESNLTLSNVHFATNNNAYQQLDELLGYCTSDIVVGDFNMSTTDIHNHRNIWSKTYQESTDFQDYISFPSEDATFDHMLLAQDYKFKLIDKQDGLSDHSAIIFQIDKK